MFRSPVLLKRLRRQQLKRLWSLGRKTPPVPVLFRSRLMPAGGVYEHVSAQWSHRHSWGLQNIGYRPRCKYFRYLLESAPTAGDQSALAHILVPGACGLDECRLTIAGLNRVLYLAALVRPDRWRYGQSTRRQHDDGARSVQTLRSGRGGHRLQAPASMLSPSASESPPVPTPAVNKCRRSVVPQQRSQLEAGDLGQSRRSAPR